MYMRLKPLIKLPEHKQLLKTMNEDFKRGFENCVCITDCFEVFFFLSVQEICRPENKLFLVINITTLSSF